MKEEEEMEEGYKEERERKTRRKEGDNKYVTQTKAEKERLKIRHRRKEG